MRQGFDTEPLYSKKNLKAKIKSYEGKINTNFYGDKVFIDCAFRIGKNYYPQVFLEECKDIVK